MRVWGGILLGLAVLANAAGAGEEGKVPLKRHGIVADLKSYPQGTAKEALASVLKAIDAKRIDYLVAQLADPAFVDDRVKRIYGGKFAEQVEDTCGRLDPLTVKQLRRFLKDGTWKNDKTEAVVRLKDVKDRCVRLRRRDGRWFLEHNSSLPAEKSE
jgi:hypothetical protein